MEKLKKLVGDDVFKQHIEPKLGAEKKYFFGEGEFIPKGRFDEVNTQVGEYKTQLADRDKQLKDLSDKAKGNEELTKQIEGLRTENQKKVDEYEAKLSKQAYDFAYNTELNSIGAKDVKVLDALIDKEKIVFKDGKFTGLNDKESIKDFRSQVQMVFQDPYSSLDPRMTVGDIIGEAMDVQNLYSDKKERETKIEALMEIVGLSKEHKNRYAHEFSGGQRQRIGIARALAVNPEFIICDEPVSALDVSVQAQIINMFKNLQKDLGLTYLFIAHDILIVRHVSDRIAVMYLGKIVELAEADELYDNPLHPYTISLLSAVPLPDPKLARKAKRIILKGDIPSPLNVPSGCPFRTRCNRATDKCALEEPVLKEINKNHYVSCLYVDS
ncbi:MAG: phage scaffolding protein [Bacilli bacterium]|nr:phage scaffolding protein [Bacilli bacterium]